MMKDKKLPEKYEFYGITLYPNRAPNAEYIKNWNKKAFKNLRKSLLDKEEAVIINKNARYIVFIDEDFIICT